LGCGSSETTNDVGVDATSDQKTKDSPIGFDVGSDADDGGTTGDAGPVACPQTAPTAGTPCSGVGLCEYGTSFWPECDVLRQCNGSTWSVVDKSSECPIQPDAGCPAESDGGQQGACTNTGWCEYPKEECFCTAGCGGPPPMPTGGGAWWCTGQGSSSCPWPRPRFGDTCTQEGTFCPYEICCGGAAMSCTGGHWGGQIDMFGCP
jgi:hypothetical protein